MSRPAQADNRYCEAVYYPSIAPEDFHPGDDLFAAIPYLRNLRLSEPQSIYQPPTVLELCAAGAIPLDQFAESHMRLPTITLSVEVAPYPNHFHELSSFAGVGFLRAPEREGLEATAEELHLESSPASDQEFWSEEYWRATQDEEVRAIEARRVSDYRQYIVELAKASIRTADGSFRPLSTATRMSSPHQSTADATPRGRVAAHAVRGKRGRSAAAASLEQRRVPHTRVPPTGGFSPGEPHDVSSPLDRPHAAGRKALSRRPTGGPGKGAAASKPAKARANPPAAPGPTPAARPSQGPAAPGLPNSVPSRAPAECPAKAKPTPPSDQPPAPVAGLFAPPLALAASAGKPPQPMVAETGAASPARLAQAEGSKRTSTSAAASRQSETAGDPMKRSLCDEAPAVYPVPMPRSYKPQAKCCVVM